MQIVKLGLFLCICLAFTEVVLFPGVIEKYLFIKSIFVYCAAVILSLVIRLRYPEAERVQLGRLFFFGLVPLLTVLSIVFRAVEILTYSNFIYTHIHMDPVMMSIFTLGVSLITLPLISRTMIGKYWKLAISVLSLFLYNLLLLFWVDIELFNYLKKEDSFVEYSTFTLFVAAGLMALYCIRYLKHLSFSKIQQWALMATLVLVAVANFFIAGEEISWGQRVLNIETPAEYAENNLQRETTLHNNRAVFSYVYTGYLLINLYGLFSWLVYNLLSPRLGSFTNTALRILTSRWYLCLLFIPSLVYVLLRMEYGSPIIDQWEEYTELIQALGIFLIWYANNAYLKRLTQPGSKT